MKKMITFLTALSLLVGCSRTSNGSGSNDSGKSSVTVNGERSEDYFSRFIYYTSGKCNDLTFPHQREGSIVPVCC